MGTNILKYKTCLGIMMIMCTKQHLSNIWSSIHEKVKQHWDWVEKKRCLQKKKHAFVLDEILDGISDVRWNAIFSFAHFHPECFIQHSKVQNFKSSSIQ